MQIRLEINRARLAAIREDLRTTGADPREDGVTAHIEAVLYAALDALRDRYRTDAEDTLAFIRRNATLYAGLAAAAEQSPDISDALDRLHSEPTVWKGSAEAQQLAGGLVAAGVLTPEQVDPAVPGSLLYFALPELPTP